MFKLSVVVCNTPPLPANGRILKGENTTSMYRYLHVLTLGCHEDYRYEGSSRTTCLDTGMWEEINAQCICKFCIIVVILLNPSSVFKNIIQ